jgi:hypothetical protein
MDFGAGGCNQGGHQDQLKTGDDEQQKQHLSQGELEPLRNVSPNDHGDSGAQGNAAEDVVGLRSRLLELNVEDLDEEIVETPESESAEGGLQDQADDESLGVIWGHIQDHRLYSLHPAFSHPDCHLGWGAVLKVSTDRLTLYKHLGDHPPDSTIHLKVDATRMQTYTLELKIFLMADLTLLPLFFTEATSLISFPSSTTPLFFPLRDKYTLPILLV